MRILSLSFLIAFEALLFSSAVSAANEVVVYSSRNAALIKPILDDYSRETGTAVRFLNASGKVLINKLEKEAENSKADLLILSDAGDLWLAAEKNLLSEVKSRTLQRSVPEYLRDPQGRWFGLSKRARTIVYSSERVDAGDLNSYASLADPQWRGKLCLQTSQSAYNQSLVAMLIQRVGEIEAEKIVRGWVENLAVAPLVDDIMVMKRIAAGLCDVGIVNSYYFARLKRQQPDIKLSLFWADQQGEGVHVNISGAGITRYAPNRARATDLLEWLTTRKTQSNFAGYNMEYPVNPRVYPVRAVAKLGKLKK